MGPECLPQLSDKLYLQVFFLKAHDPQLFSLALLAVGAVIFLAGFSYFLQASGANYFFSSSGQAVPFMSGASVEGQSSSSVSSLAGLTPSPQFPQECLDFYEEHHEHAGQLSDHHTHLSAPSGCMELLPSSVPQEEASCFFTHAKINSLKPKSYGEECISHDDCPGSLEFTLLAHHGTCAAGADFHCTIYCSDDAFCNKQTGGLLKTCCRECAGQVLSKEIGFCVK